jgi:hypothetical protein
VLNICDRQKIVQSFPELLPSDEDFFLCHNYSPLINSQIDFFGILRSRTSVLVSKPM